MRARAFRNRTGIASAPPCGEQNYYQKGFMHIPGHIPKGTYQQQSQQQWQASCHDDPRVATCTQPEVLAAAVSDFKCPGDRPSSMHKQCKNVKSIMPLQAKP